MCGWELVGRRVSGGHIQYTDWGMLSIELLLGTKGRKGEKVSLYTPTKIEGLTIHEQLLNEIQKDPKGVVLEEHYPRLEADCCWILDGRFLYDPKRNRYLTR